MEAGTTLARRDLYISNLRLGDIAKAKGDFSAAQVYYEKTLFICEALAAETGTTKARRDLAFSNNRLGDLAKAMGDQEKAQEYYGKNKAIKETLDK